MRVDAFDFDLPDELIALRPAQPRDQARMLVVREDGTCEHKHVFDLPQLLHSGDALVVNDTRVVAARLRGLRERRAEGAADVRIELLLHKRIAPDRFRAFARPARRLAAGDAVHLGASLKARIVGRGEGGEVEVQFALAGKALDAAIAAEGEVPLPPYIVGKRKPDDRDIADYQTIFARQEGSIAAPTAGLHFTPALFERLAQRGIERETVTLHVGAGTFLPVSVDDTADHRMHSEWACVEKETAARLNRVRGRGGRLVAVGTTSLRTLESAAGQDGRIEAYCGETDIFIAPGYRFKTAEILLTNFHLPRSTLFMLVSAFCGLDVMKAAYRQAIAARYRFYSYGDACLLFRPPQ